MAINYPTSLDTFSNPSASDATNNLTTPHATQHANANDAIEALEAKVGITSSTPTSGKVLRATGTGTSVWGAIVDGDIDAAAEIAVSKLADGAALQFLRTDSAGTGVEWADVPSGRVYHNTTQTANNGSVTNWLQFNSNRWLTGVTQANGNATNSRLVAPLAGKYLVGALITWPNNTTGTYRRVGIFYNNTTTIGFFDGVPPAGTNILGQFVFTVYSMAANDYVEAFCVHDATANLTMPSSGSYTPEFFIARIG